MLLQPGYGGTETYIKAASEGPFLDHREGTAPHGAAFCFNFARETSVFYRLRHVMLFLQLFNLGLFGLGFRIFSSLAYDFQCFIGKPV